MILSQGLSYSLRVGAFLALQDPDARFSSHDLATQTNIPKHYCSKILKKLVNAGLLTSMRGPGGGFTVADEPANIRFYDLLMAIDIEAGEEQCVFGLDKCGDSEPCPLHFRWKICKEFFVEWSKDSTLLDVINDVNSKPALRRYRR